MRKTLLNIGNSYLFTGIVVAIDKDFGYEVLDDEWSADDGTQPHAVTGVENEDYVIASSAQTVAYNPWGKVSGISEGDDLRNYMNYYNEFTDYDCNGNVTRLLRGGLTNNLNGTFGLVDNLWMTYEGNRLVSVRDSAFHFTYANATDFDGVRGQEYPLTYDNAGALVSDAGRGIARTDYDLCGNPVRIQFTDGSVTRYIYSAAGEKLRVTHLTAVPNITVPIGTTRELAPSEILAADSTDYLLGGTLTMRNGRIDRYLFDEGYCQAAKYASNPVQDGFTPYYFDRDHLGSVRQVIKAYGSTKGTVVQRMEYYPSGLQFCDNTTDSDVQPQRYNGKELDKMHGLNTYDYGARQYNPVTARWDRMDPLCEKYYGVSPYSYCHGDPVNKIDPDGRAPGDFFNTINEAAIDFGNYYNGTSILWNVEFGSTIYMIVDEKNIVGFTYSIANKGDHASVQVSDAPYGAIQVARIHTHGNSIPGPDGKQYDANSFSGVYHSNRLSPKMYAERSPGMNKKEKGENDIGNANQSGCFYSYLVAPNGTLQQYNVFTGIISIISEDMPSSNVDADRRNVNDAKVNPDIGTERTSYSDFRHISPLINSAYFKYWMEAVTGKNNW